MWRYKVPGGTSNLQKFGRLGEKWAVFRFGPNNYDKGVFRGRAPGTPFGGPKLMMLI